MFGDAWSDAASILPFICLSTIVLGSIAVASTSYLAAVGQPGIVAWASASLGVVWLVVTALLLPRLGVTAIGFGNLAGSLVEAFVLDRATRRAAGVAPHRPLNRPLVVAIVAGAAGYSRRRRGPASLWTVLAAGVITLGIAVLGLIASLP